MLSLVIGYLPLEPFRHAQAERALVAVELAGVARAVGEIVRARDHEALGVHPRGDHVVRGRELVLVLERLDQIGRAHV